GGYSASGVCTTEITDEGSSSSLDEASSGLSSRQGSDCHGPSESSYICYRAARYTAAGNADWSHNWFCRFTQWSNRRCVTSSRCHETTSRTGTRTAPTDY